MAAVVAAMAVCGGALGLDKQFDLTSDPGLNSRNIHLSGRLDPTAAHPYVGFWKVKCSDDFGLAIAAAGPNLYSVSFCGPGGCFKPGTYRPDTPLVGDTNYKIVSTTRMQVGGGSGKNFTDYSRCWPNK